MIKTNITKAIQKKCNSTKIRYYHPSYEIAIALFEHYLDDELLRQDFVHWMIENTISFRTRDYLKTKECKDSIKKDKQLYCAISEYVTCKVLNVIAQKAILNDHLMITYFKIFLLGFDDKYYIANLNISTFSNEMFDMIKVLTFKQSSSESIDVLLERKIQQGDTFYCQIYLLRDIFKSQDLANKLLQNANELNDSLQVNLDNGMHILL